MRRKLLIAALVVLCGHIAVAQYNPLIIPDTISGTTFNLALRDTFKQFLPGNQTITGGINGNFWGPTLIFRQGDTVHMNVQSYMNDSTTLHWHGMHLPAVMDGGPHQIIPPGTLWQPYWLVKNQAATYWYHPHLHTMSEQQMTMGLGGFIIVRDAAEAALALPRTYGIDDIPLALTSRSFDATNALVYVNRHYGDTCVVNGTLHPQTTLPKQYVRLRLLNAEMERAYNLVFSDNRTFYIIANDGGLLDAPVSATRIKLSVGERAEIMVNLGSDALGSSVELMAYNAGQEFGFGGGEPNTTGPFGSLLNNRNFNVLHIVVGATTASPITSVPTALVTNTYPTAADATVTRTLLVTDGTPGPGGAPFQFDHVLFDFNTINKTVVLGTTEKWTVINNNVFGHAFHIHDVEFKIVSRSSHPVGAYESGWKDTYYLQVNDTVSFVAKFDDYADAIHPFMYHCHFAPHEDGGMMQQFVVVDHTGVNNTEKPAGDYSVYPNPASMRLYFNFSDPAMQVYYVTITNSVGRTLCMLPRPQLNGGIDISNYAPGVYFVQLTDEQTKTTITKKFIKE
ncbi:bilirubin oxidase [Flavipsychrobacter stenotrophus]|uniref:Bilirubin oxidase n=1 Tax=Flavipsychrobacter stenotrophus TaxID=2077091 RepID=A0A2S7SUR5_9BACT|nr:multicopper oxidase domain-containing protein [Flavipsychrobacter stenotrophus]PQJ10484.1 bilirubin oxidase [Flavipsychrobacter stenotrophus]